MVSNIEVLVLDIDGVVTDGTAVVGGSHDEAKRVSFHDLDAVARAQRCGLRVALLTGEDNDTVDRIAHRFGIELVHRGKKDKASALAALANELGVALSAICYVGDSDRDADALVQAGLGLVPDNATMTARAAADRVLTRPGGDGAVAEAVEIVLRLKEDEEACGALEKAMREIVEDSVRAHTRLLHESMPVLGRIAQTMIRTIRTGRKILLFGNGGSAADAQHVAGELIGRFARESDPWPAIALTTDSSVLTAIGNDWDFAEIFARQVRGLAMPGDMVAGISTSGRSVNVIRALEAARSRGATTVAFTGERGSAMAPYADICFHAQASSTPRIQELHLLAWHTVCEIVERELTTVPRVRA